MQHAVLMSINTFYMWHFISLAKYLDTGLTLTEARFTEWYTIWCEPGQQIYVYECVLYTSTGYFTFSVQ